VKAVIEFEVEDREDFIRQWKASGTDEDWYLLDGASQKIHAREILEDVREKSLEEDN